MIKWKGSVEDRSGIAIFEQADKVMEIRLECFQDFHALSTLVYASFVRGKEVAEETMKTRITDAMAQST